jgi:hypothetical protein
METTAPDTSSIDTSKYGFDNVWRALTAMIAANSTPICIKSIETRSNRASRTLRGKKIRINESERKKSWPEKLLYMFLKIIV